MKFMVGMKAELVGVKSEMGGMKGEISYLRNAILRLDSKVDVGLRKLDAKTDFRCDEILSATNAYATKTDRRLARLEASRV